MILPVHWFFRSRSRPATLAAFPSTPRLPSPRCSPSGLSRPSRRFPIFSILVRLSPQLDALRAHTAETQPQLHPARALGYAARGPVITGPRVTKGLSPMASLLNSARRHCTSPRRGRQVEWSDERPGNVRLHFRSRRSCRRCASDASQESVGAGSIDVTTNYNPLRTNSVKRCEG